MRQWQLVTFLALGSWWNRRVCRLTGWGSRRACRVAIVGYAASRLAGEAVSFDWRSGFWVTLAMAASGGIWYLSGKVPEVEGETISPHRAVVLDAVGGWSFTVLLVLTALAVISVAGAGVSVVWALQMSNWFFFLTAFGSLAAGGGPGRTIWADAADRVRSMTPYQTPGPAMVEWP